MLEHNKIHNCKSQLLAEQIETTKLLNKGLVEKVLDSAQRELAK